MSELIAVALISGGFVALSTVANLCFNYRLEKARLKDRASERAAEHFEWYRRHVFERRLEAVRRAHRWLMDIRRALAALGSNDPQSEAAAELRTLAREARDWYDDNAIYFQDGLPTVSRFVGVTNVAMDYGASLDRNAVFSPYSILDEADREVRERAHALMESVRSPMNTGTAVEA